MKTKKFMGIVIVLALVALPGLVWGQAANEEVDIKAYQDQSASYSFGTIDIDNVETINVGAGGTVSSYKGYENVGTGDFTYNQTTTDTTDTANGNFSHTQGNFEARNLVTADGGTLVYSSVGTLYQAQTSMTQQAGISLVGRVTGNTQEFGQTYQGQTVAQNYDVATAMGVTAADVAYSGVQGMALGVGVPTSVTLPNYPANLSPSFP